VKPRSAAASARRTESAPGAKAGAPGASLRDRTGWLIAALLVVAGLAQAWLVSGLDHLPSPFFGGDYSYEMGCVRSILASRNPMASCSTCGGLPHYLPFYGTILALVTAGSGLTVVKGMLVMSVVFRVLSVGVVALVFSRLFGRATGLVIAGLWTLYRPQMIFKYTEFTTGIVAPLYFLALHRYLEAPSTRRAAIVGLVLAIAGYSHTVVFVGGSLIAVAAVAIVAAGWWRPRVTPPAAPAPTAPRAGARRFGIAGHLALLVTCASLALGYWWKPIFVYHGRASAHYLEWNSGTSLVNLPERLAYARRFLASFLDVSDWPRAVVNALAAIGLVCLWRIRDRARFLPGALIAGLAFAYMFHYFVTMPLFRTHFVPIYIAWMLWGFAVLFLAAIPVRLIFDRLASATDRFAVAAVVLVATTAGIAADARRQSSDPAMLEARQPAHPFYAAFETYVTQNTHHDDIVLSTNELSFAWSALTGRKTVVTRRAHSDPYMDMDARNRDAALILYGNDDAARRRLLRQYGVRYLLWTAQWEDSEYRKDPAGRAVYVDPLFWFQDRATDSLLAAAGVKLDHVHGWVDPAMRGPDFPRFDLSLVSRANYTRRSRPWSEMLDPYLEPVWSYPMAGDTLGTLYRVRE